MKKVEIKVECENKLQLIMALHSMIEILGKDKKLDFDFVLTGGVSVLGNGYQIKILERT